MSTLEQTKSYGMNERLQTLTELSRTRLNGTTPHQAPQRERVSSASRPATARPARRKDSSPRRWIDLVQPDRNLGVPQLMMIIEPKVVWERVVSSCGGKQVESSYAAGEFFSGWHRGGKNANGLYEGSYWELIGDCDEMMEMLKKLANAPPLLEEPQLDLPSSAQLPLWEDFKPDLQPLPSAPDLPALKLPPYRKPILENTLPFIEPKLLTVPDVPLTPQQEPTPIFFPPGQETMEQFVPEEYIEPQPPIIPAAPLAPTFRHPTHGHDWAGTCPHVIEASEFKSPAMINLPSFHHPPKNLPKPPKDFHVRLDRPDLDLNPVPRVELAWEGGVDPEPNYSSKPGTRANSRPVSAAAPQRPPSRPASALRPAPPPSLPPHQVELARVASPPPPSSPPRSPPLPSPPRSPSPPHSPARFQAALSREPSSIADAGKPRLWMNFEKPFADLPPLFIPPEPKLGEINGLEPMLSDFPPQGLESLPDLILPLDKALPRWNPPALKLPNWRPPCEPRPIGFLRGTAPVVIIDVSGTMNRVHQGRFREMQQCSQELLEPNGELASSAAKFDVIAFASGAWSWSVSHSQKMDLLSSSQTYYTGRQVGSRPASGKSRPTSAKTVTVSKARLLPTEPELLLDAQRWIQNWPAAQGTTSMLAALMKADDHWEADSWLVLSDGLAHDPGQCIDFIEKRAKNGYPVPAMHCIGFFPKNTPENHEGRRYLKALASMTGGSYQEYDPKLYKVYQVVTEGEGFIKFDPATESPEDRTEREWAQIQLRAERMKNNRLGIVERIEVTIHRVMAMHQKMRVQAKAREFEEEMSELKMHHDRVVEVIKVENTRAREAAEFDHREIAMSVEARNKDKVEAATRAYEAAYKTWYAVYEDALFKWREERDFLEAQRAEAIAALNANGGSRSSSRPASASSRPISTSRPASARPTSARPQSAAKEAPLITIDAMDGGSKHTLTRVDESEPSVAAAIDPTPPTIPRPSSASRRPPSARPVSARPFLTPHQEDVETLDQPAVDEDAFIQEDDGGDEGEPSVAIVEQDQEVLRQLAPAEVVKALDDSNAQALSSIKQEWSQLVKESEESNARKIQMIEQNKDAIERYKKEVTQCYAEAFAREVTWAALNSAANALALSRAKSEHEAEVKRIEAENARVALLHAKEVESKLSQERTHKELMEKWGLKKEALNEQHKAAVKYARDCHAENVEAAFNSWKRRKAEIEEMNAKAIGEAEERHAQALIAVKEANLNHKLAHDEQVKTKKAIQADNEKRTAEARILHQQALEQLQVGNAEKLLLAEIDHKSLCERLVVEHEEAVKAAARDHEHLRSFLHQQNEQAAKDAMEAFRQAIQEAQEEHEDLCHAIQQQHKEEMIAVALHNEAILPQVHVARIAQLELGRVQAFAEHIKFCAKKIALGVNFLNNQPCFDRVVEMSALTEALELAFPELKGRPEEYPWPDHERRLEVGTGWTEAPPVRPIEMKDASVEIARLVKEKIQTLDYKKPQRLKSAYPSSARGSSPLIPTPASFHELKSKIQATRDSRPQSAAPLVGTLVGTKAHRSVKDSSSHLPARLKVKLSDLQSVVARAALLNKAKSTKFTGTVIIDDY